MVLLVVDTQQGIMNEKLFKYQEVILNIKHLIKIVREKQIEVIYVRHDDGIGCDLTPGNPEYEIYEEFKPLLGEKIFDKTVNSAFKESGLLEYLKAKGERQIIIVGLQTDYCIDACIKCGFEHGFQMIVPTYTNTTTNNHYMSAEASYHYYNEFIWKDRYATCVSLNDLVKQL